MLLKYLARSYRQNFNDFHLDTPQFYFVLPISDLFLLEICILFSPFFAAPSYDTLDFIIFVDIFGTYTYILGITKLIFASTGKYKNIWFFILLSKRLLRSLLLFLFWQSFNSYYSFQYFIENFHREQQFLQLFYHDNQPDIIYFKSISSPDNTK